MSDKQIFNVGILGCANVAEKRTIPAMLKSKDLNLKAIASRTEAKANDFASRYDCEVEYSYQKLIEREDIDIVYIPLPTGLHYEWAIKAIENGKHILVEKSLGINTKEVQAILNASIKHQVCVWENFMFTFHSQHQFVKEKIEAGVLGDIRCLRTSFGFPPFPSKENIRYNKSLGGGSLLDAGAYTLKAAQYLFPGDWKVKGAFLRQEEGYEVDIHGGAFLVNTENQIICEAAFGFDNYYQCNYEIWGTKGKLIAHRAYTAGTGFNPLVTIETPEGKEDHTLPDDDHFLNIMTAFSNAIRNNAYQLNHKELMQQAELIENTFLHAKS